MDNIPSSDLPYQLPRQIYLQVVHTLRGAMPPAPDDSPETIDRREQVAIAQVAALVPANADEAQLASYAVAAGMQAVDCLRLAAQHAMNLQLAGQLRAQAASMGREARGYRATLLREQAVRQKREASDTTREPAAWTEHSALGLMAEARQIMPRKRAEPAEPPPPPSPEQAAEAERRERLRRDAEHYVIVQTKQAQKIRKHRGMPPDADFEPPEPELMDAIINGKGSNFRWCDEYVPWVPKATAPT
jgi:hypothetical protein